MGCAEGLEQAANRSRTGREQAANRSRMKPLDGGFGSSVALWRKNPVDGVPWSDGMDRRDGSSGKAGSGSAGIKAKASGKRGEGEGRSGTGGGAPGTDY